MDNGQPSILIIEDSKDDREMYAQFLSMKGYASSAAANGKEGLDKAIALSPDLILMDLRLPGIDGWELVNRLKADERTRHCAVVIVTGLTWLQPKTLECDAWLTKPCRLDRLEEELTRILETRAYCRR